ncbi:MAG: glycerol-3-phosphate dehydrogenase subunit B [Parasphingorhabdus sp.]|jgi:glycerol-3-phosphate dehydrogenase subunit B
MQSDVIIIGAELDGLIAAMRLTESGYSVRVICNGASSLHYAPDGIHVLGQTKFGAVSTGPFDAIPALDRSHPYRKLGIDLIKKALEWYTSNLEKLHQPLVIGSNNIQVFSAVGLHSPAYAVNRHQATFENIYGKSIAIVGFAGHRDSPGELLANGLQRHSAQITIVEVPPPCGVLENAALAKALDTIDSIDSYFEQIKGAIPKHAEIVIFPAIMGLRRFRETLSAAQRVIGLPCIEVPTLPPSIPGMRLELYLRDQLKNAGVTFQVGAFPTSYSVGSDGQFLLKDTSGRDHQASVVVLSSGGVLMGGLDVDSHGLIHETALDLDVIQTAPLKVDDIAGSLDALHTAGVETDDGLRPTINGICRHQNLFVTGRTLAHWNPSKEGSADGVCIATGWAAAENACIYLEKRNAA